MCCRSMVYIPNGGRCLSQAKRSENQKVGWMNTKVTMGKIIAVGTTSQCFLRQRILDFSLEQLTSVECNFAIVTLTKIWTKKPISMSEVIPRGYIALARADES